VEHEPVIVLDTHVVVWWVSGSDRLSARAKRAIEQGLRKGPAIVSTISVLEIATAVRRGRLQLASSIDEWLTDVSALPEVRFEPVSAEIARVAGGLADTAPGDPADRIIVATAQTLGARLVSADAVLRASPNVKTVW
jgi:PIN domain nuclease of toxin-antitoxin system